MDQHRTAQGSGLRRKQPQPAGTDPVQAADDDKVAALEHELAGVKSRLARVERQFEQLEQRVHEMMGGPGCGEDEAAYGGEGPGMESDSDVEEDGTDVECLPFLWRMVGQLGSVRALGPGARGRHVPSMHGEL